jgi:hypothetical protein
MQPKIETDISGTRAPIQGAIQPNLNPMIPQMQPNMMYPPGMLPHQNYMNPMGYNPHYMPPYPISHVPGYPPNMVNMNYMTPQYYNGLNPHTNVSPNSTSITNQAYVDNKTVLNETKGDYLLIIFI